MASGGGSAVIASPFVAHWRRPILSIAKLFRQPRILQHPVDDCRHLLVAPGERRIMGQTDCEYFTHLTTSWRATAPSPGCDSGRVAPSLEKYAERKSRSERLFRTSS